MFFNFRVMFGEFHHFEGYSIFKTCTQVGIIFRTCTWMELFSELAPGRNYFQNLHLNGNYFQNLHPNGKYFQNLHGWKIFSKRKLFSKLAAGRKLFSKLVPERKLAFVSRKISILCFVFCEICSLRSGHSVGIILEERDSISNPPSGSWKVSSILTISRR